MPPVPLTPEQQVAADQARFDGACRIAKRGIAAATPIITAAHTAGKVSDNWMLGYQSLVIVAETECDGSVKLNSFNTEQLIQQLFDIAGQVTALVIEAKSK